MMHILCYGDSNTYGYNPLDGMRYPKEVRWPGVLQQLRPEDEIIEEGCNGRTAAFTPAEEAWKDGRSYLKACLNSHKPLDLVIYMLGSNDLKREFQASPAQIAGGIHEILQTTAVFLQEKQGVAPEVLLISPPHIREGIEVSPFAHSFDRDAADRSHGLADLYRKEAELAAKAGLPRCRFLDAAEVIEASETDCLHLTPEAHRKLAERIDLLLQED